MEDFARRLADIEAVDFFESAGRERVAALLDRWKLEIEGGVRPAGDGTLRARGIPRAYLGDPSASGYRSNRERLAHPSFHRPEGAVRLRARSRLGSEGCRSLRHVRRRARPPGRPLYLRDAPGKIRSRRCRGRTPRGHRPRSRSEGRALRRSRDAVGRCPGRRTSEDSTRRTTPSSSTEEFSSRRSTVGSSSRLAALRRGAHDDDASERLEILRVLPPARCHRVRRSNRPCRVHAARSRGGARLGHERGLRRWPRSRAARTGTACRAARDVSRIRAGRRPRCHHRFSSLRPSLLPHGLGHLRCLRPLRRSPVDAGALLWGRGLGHRGHRPFGRQAHAADAREELAPLVHLRRHGTHYRLDRAGDRLGRPARGRSIASDLPARLPPLDSCS